MTRRTSTIRSLSITLAIAAAQIAFLAPGASAAPAVGEKAPAFELPGTDGTVHRLSDSLGKRGLVLAWFPKAFTPG